MNVTVSFDGMWATDVFFVAVYLYQKYNRHEVLKSNFVFPLNIHILLNIMYDSVEYETSHTHSTMRLSEG